LRAVGLSGAGEMGDRIGAIGDFKDRLGRLDCAAVEMLRESFGLTDREASILALALAVVVM
jgi:hypothetical protein